MKSFRLQRLLHPRSGRCLDVAVDHGFFGEPSFLRGIEDMPAVLDTLVAAAPDAIQLTVGQAPLLQARPGRTKPALVLRTDAANVYGARVPEVAWSTLIADPVGTAVRLDAVCVVVNLFDIPGRDDLRRQCVEHVAALVPACEAAGMPLMVEPLAMKPGADGSGYQVDGDTQRIVALVRQAAELGADLVKADPTDDLGEYHRVVEAARVPVLVRGGGRVGDEELLRRTEAVLAQGAQGIVYGRNIVQHEDPAGITRALLAILHDGATTDEALGVVHTS